MPHLLEQSMPHEVWIPPVHRDLTHGVERVAVEGETVGAVIGTLEMQFPGLAVRLMVDGQLRPGIAVAVNGVIATRGVRQKLVAASEIHFVPAMAGG